MILRALVRKSVILMTALSALVPNAAAREMLADPQIPYHVETIAEDIATAIYELDYLDPDLAPGLIQQTATHIMADAELNFQEQTYLVEILDIWFATLPNISAAIAQTMSDITVEQTESMSADALEVSLGVPMTEAASIMSRASSLLSDLISAPPTQTDGDNSDY